MNNYIKRFHDKEKWKPVELKSPFVEKYEILISNYGNVKRITLMTKLEKVLNQTFVEGYPSINLRSLMPITKKESDKFKDSQQEIAVLRNEIKQLNQRLAICDEEEPLYLELYYQLVDKHNCLDKTRKAYMIKYKKMENKRKINFGNLVHRLVAIYFIEKPSENHNLVAHIDYDKLNNHHSNLQWMTREENVIHQKNSPYVIKSKIIALQKPRITNSKLTVNQVMILKKRMNEGVSLRELAKRNKVTETQLLRIKRGENWGKIPAAL